MRLKKWRTSVKFRQYVDWQPRMMMKLLWRGWVKLDFKMDFRRPSILKIPLILILNSKPSFLWNEVGTFESKIIQRLAIFALNNCQLYSTLLTYSLAPRYGLDYSSHFKIQKHTSFITTDSKTYHQQFNLCKGIYNY